jgi:cyclic-di-GMP phosphodiesterase, flagellum assembly factor TipF
VSRRFGIDLIAERIVSESMIVNLLDYDVHFGEGFLFSLPPVQGAAGGAGKSAEETPAGQAGEGAAGLRSRPGCRGRPSKLEHDPEKA